MHDRVRARVREKLLELRPDEAISGMAQGLDQWAAEVCCDLGIPFVAAVPFPGQELDWPWPAQQQYYTLLNRATRVHLVCPDPPLNRGEAIERLHARNHWMVEHSDALVAAWDGSKGGTFECIKYAEKVGRVIHRIGDWTQQVVG